MHLTGLLDHLAAAQTFAAVLNHLQSNRDSGSQSVLRTARPFVVAGLARALGRPVLVVTARADRAYDFAEQIPVWLPQAQVERFLEPTPLFYEHAPWTTTAIQGRLKTLAALTPPLRMDATPAVTAERPLVVVTSAHALMQKTLPVRDFRAGSRAFKVGQFINLDKMLAQWVSVGYQPASVVVQPGTFTRRGGIIDVFPVAMDVPVRVELFGDEIDSLRTFDPTSQRSLDTVESFITTPAREALPKDMPRALTRLGDWFASLPDTESDPASPADDMAALENGQAFPAAEYYLPYLYPAAASLLDHLPEETLIVMDDWRAFEDTVAEQEAQALEQRDYHRAQGRLPTPEALPYHTWDALHESLRLQQPLHLGLPDPALEPDSSPVLGDIFSPGPRYGGQVRPFLDQLLSNPPGDQMLVITRQAQRFAELWAEGHAPLPVISQVETPDDLGRVNFVEGELSGGFIMQATDGPALHVLTDAEIFGWRRPEPRRRQAPRPQPPERSFADLNEGDVVVHIDYGVGIFRGIIKRQLDGTEREYLLVEYAGNDLLYVPIHQADRLSRYIGVEGRPPALNRLGTQEWARTKSTTRAAVEDIAEELLELYAERQVVRGHAFGPDTPWQHELEASFPYVETEDQLRALREVKQDMEASRPMDRLICGDVGYGKTEIALRAAFKAVLDGKQVAVLVPTTVLAQQHFATFSERLAAFPIKVAMLSRFRTPTEQASILAGLAAGTVDIVIGTHRLLQSDVQFKDLGLLVIDEEQRFGVTHKEMLKQKRTEVDVLTLTATPIPRTLYMALTGVRDISLIQTAPQERLPVVTHVGVYDEKIVRQAVLREIERGGQVFFVHNRVKTIETITRRLRRLVPEATIVVGHGQMDDRQLETVMTQFAQGEYDVLVCTTIIENGVDIPNANTMILDRADLFGLAQLYQLRGRVGRGAHQAYVYFMHPRTHRLTSDARARLETIHEYSDLGVGMSIAMRDLEIRGMGDMLGSRQSGHIEAVGFHLYTQLLAQTVQHLKGEQPQTAPDEEPVGNGVAVTIDLPLPAYLPTDYIPDMSLRLQIYRRLATLHGEEDLDAMQAELHDRFGQPPRAVENLLYQIQIKLLAQQAQATAIGHESGKVYVKLPYLGSTDRRLMQDYIGNQIKVSRTALWFPVVEADVWQPLLVETLRRLRVEDISQVFAG